MRALPLLALIALVAGCAQGQPNGNLSGVQGNGGGTHPAEDAGGGFADSGSAADAGNSVAPDFDAGAPASPGPQPLPDGGKAPTWTELYQLYFGPGTNGNCGNPNNNCHANVNNHFACGATQDSCYQGLVAAALVNASDPVSSPLSDPTVTPLSWYGSGGNMPDEKSTPDQQAADYVSAWIFAGAQNN